MLSNDRNTPYRDGDLISHPVAASKKIYAGALVVLNASGYAEPGKTDATLIAAGRAESQVDNSAGINGAATILVRRGIFRFNNFATDAVTRTEVNKSCYIVDDATVAKTSATNTRSIAGKVVDLDSSGVWVELR
jgi:hypothetical protein